MIINETAARQFGWEDPIGKEIINLVEDPPQTGRVVGVIKDYHFRSLQQAIQPVMMRIEPLWYRTIAVRIGANDIPATVNFLEATWQRFVPQRPFEYSFLDDQFAQQYQAVERFGQILGAFTFLAIFIACLGLFGLSSYLIVARTKEVGIRKVLGASLANLVSLLSREFLLLVLLANLIAAPIAWISMKAWLTTFAYRTSVDIGLVALAGGLTLLLAFMAVSTQTIKTALLNPVKTLRSET